MKIRILLLLSLFIYQSCNSQNNNKDVINISNELLNEVYEVENIGDSKYDSTRYFHCEYDFFNDKEMIVNVTFSRYKAKNDYCAKTEVNGIEAFIYFDCNKKINSLSSSEAKDPFFVPDSKMLKFYISYNDENISIRKLTYYGNKNESVDDEVKW